MLGEDGAPDQSGTSFRASAQFVMQPIRDFYYSSSTFRAFAVYRKRRNAVLSLSSAFSCTIHGEIHNLIEVLHLRAQIEQAYSSFS